MSRVGHSALPTGEQFTLTVGNATVVVGSVAAVLRQYSVAGIDLTQTWPDDRPTPYGCGIILAPWPNRITDARWEDGGTTQQLDITDVTRGAAIHGLLRNTAYVATQVSETSVTLAAAIYPQHGYPYTLATSVTYSLASDGLTVTHRVENIGGGRAPLGVGAHPFLKIGSHPTADLQLFSSAKTYTEVDDKLSPVSENPVVGTGFDLSAGPRVGDLTLDTAYTDLDLIAGAYRARLVAPDQSAVELWADPSFGWQQIFVTHSFPDVGVAVAIEPMTCGINALNTGRGLQHLEPGEIFTGNWGIRRIES